MSAPYSSTTKARWARRWRKANELVHERGRVRHEPGRRGELADVGRRQRLGAGALHRAQHVLRVQHAHDRVRVAAPDRVAGVGPVEHLARDLGHRGVAVERDHVAPVGHHLDHLDPLQVEDGAQHVVLVLAHGPLHARRPDQAAQLVGRVGLLVAGLGHAGQPQQRARRVVERPVQRPADHVEDVERPRDPERHRLRPADRHGLGHLLAHHDVERGEDQEADRERDGVQQGLGHAGGDEERLQQRGHERLADPAQAQRAMVMPSWQAAR
jgi:hypothetical protein